MNPQANMPQIAAMQANQAPQRPSMPQSAGAPPVQSPPMNPTNDPNQGRPSDDQVMQAIDQRMSSIPPEQQELVKQAIAAVPQLPQILQAIVGPPLVDFGGDQLAKYFTLMAQQVNAGQSNSPQAAAPAPAQPENPAVSAPAQAGQSAEATQNIPNMGV